MTIFHLDDVSYDDVLETGGLNEDWYSRFHNPTVAATAEEIARLEHAPAALMTSSGMAAIASTLISLAKAGDRVVAARELYGDTFDLLTRDLPNLGLEVEFVRGDSLPECKAALASGNVAVAYAETISNPQLRLLCRHHPGWVSTLCRPRALPARGGPAGQSGRDGGDRQGRDRGGPRGGAVAAAMAVRRLLLWL